MRRWISAWIQASRMPFFVATLVPLSLGGALAAAEGQWHGLRWGVALLASFLVHLSTNLANDYFDHLSGVDDGDSLGGSRVIQEGKITPRQIVVAMVLFYGLAFLAGLWLLWETRLLGLIPLMAFSFIGSLGYTAPPFRFGYRGMGELIAGLSMGPVMVAGSHAVVAGHFSWRALGVSIPVGLLVALILFFQSLPDLELDRAAGKLTLAVRVGAGRCLTIYWGLGGGALMVVCGLVAGGLLHPAALVCVLMCLPLQRGAAMIDSTEEWPQLHGRGRMVRLIYLGTGTVLVLSVILFG